MKKRILCFLCALCCLCCVGRADSQPVSEEAWTEILNALYSDAAQPVPPRYRIQARQEEMDRLGKTEAGWMNLLCCSTDAENMKENFGRADAMLVCRVNLRTGESRLLSMLEESLVHLDGLPEAVSLRYVSCFGGPRLIMRALNDALGLHLNRYLALNMDAFVHIVDAMGGVKLTLTEDEAEALEMSAGEQMLTGRQALFYIRLRRAGDGAGRMRGLLEAVFTQMLSAPSVNQAFALIDTVMVAADTNLTTDNVIDLVFAVLGQDTGSTMETGALLPAGDALDEAAREQALDFLYARGDE